MKEVNKALGLEAGATEKDAVAEISKLKKENADLQKQVAKAAAKPAEMPKAELEKIAKELLKKNPAKRIYMTGDGQGFISEATAKAHAKAKGIGVYPFGKPVDDTTEIDA